MDRKEAVAYLMKTNYHVCHRADGRIEIVCEHGVGHTVWYPKCSSASHGCDGCCKKYPKLSGDLQ